MTSKHSLSTLILIVFGCLAFLYLRGFGLLALVIITCFVQAGEFKYQDKSVYGGKITETRLAVTLIFFSLVTYLLILRVSPDSFIANWVQEIESLSQISTIYDQYITILNSETPALGTVMSPSATAPHKTALLVKANPQKYIALHASFILTGLIFIIGFVLTRHYRTSTNIAMRDKVEHWLSSHIETQETKRLLKGVQAVLMFLALGYICIYIKFMCLPSPSWSLYGYASSSSVRLKRKLIFWVILNYSMLWVFARYFLAKVMQNKTNNFAIERS